MKNKIIEQRCNFKTQRLLVGSWTQGAKALEFEEGLANRVLKILTPNVTLSLPRGWHKITTVAAAKKWIRARDEESHFLTIQLVSTNEIIGFVFLFESDLRSRYYNLRFGYLLAEDFWSKGLGTELIRGLVKWCQRAGDIKSISGGVERDNRASIKVLEKTGFSVSKQDSVMEESIFYEYQFDVKKKPWY